MNVDQLLQNWGYWAVFLLVGAESLGIPLPGETILIAAGVYAGSTHKLSVWGIWLAAVAGAIIGDNIGFAIGRHGGYRLVRPLRPLCPIRRVEAQGRDVRVRPSRWQSGVLRAFRSVLRTYAAFLAGTSRMHWPRFLFWNATGGVLWASIYTFGSYFAGNAIERVQDGQLRTRRRSGGCRHRRIVAVRRKANQLVLRAEEAFPGPLPES